MNDLYRKINHQNILTAYGVKKSFGEGSKKTEILRGLDFAIKKGEDVSIVGASGVGKSTFLSILGSLDKPTHGEVSFKGKALNYKSDKSLASFRNKSLGFIFQSHFLLPEFNSIENVTLPCQIGGMPIVEAKDRACHYLEKLGLQDRMMHYPSELSGGEKQRVAICRAIVMSPEILLADEPTGNLDSSNGTRVQDLLFKLKEDLKLTLIVVTHDAQFALKFSKVYKMRDGLWV